MQKFWFRIKMRRNASTPVPFVVGNLETTTNKITIEKKKYHIGVYVNDGQVYVICDFFFFFAFNHRFNIHTLKN